MGFGTGVWWGGGGALVGELSYKDTSDGEGNVIYDIRLLKTYARRNTIIIGMLHVSSIEMSSFFFFFSFPYCL